MKTYAVRKNGKVYAVKANSVKDAIRRVKDAPETEAESDRLKRLARQEIDRAGFAQSGHSVWIEVDRANVDSDYVYRIHFPDEPRSSGAYPSEVENYIANRHAGSIAEKLERAVKLVRSLERKYPFKWQDSKVKDWEVIQREWDKKLEKYEQSGKFDDKQLEKIRWGLIGHLDVSKYADPKFNEDQMREIYEGLKSHIDVSKYADPKYDWKQMYEIHWGLEHHVDVSKYADPKFDPMQMFEIRLGLEKHLDVSKYADPKYSWREMNKIREQLEHGTYRG